MSVSSHFNALRKQIPVRTLLLRHPGQMGLLIRTALTTPNLARMVHVRSLVQIYKGRSPSILGTSLFCVM